MCQVEITVPSSFIEAVIDSAIRHEEDLTWLLTMREPVCVWSFWLPSDFPMAPVRGMKCKFFSDGPWPCYKITAVEMDGVFVQLPR